MNLPKLPRMPDIAQVKKYGGYGLLAAAAYLLLTKSGRNVTRSAFLGIYGPMETSGPGYVRLSRIGGDYHHHAEFDAAEKAVRDERGRL